MAREADVVRSLVEMAGTLVDDFNVVDGSLDPQAWAPPASRHPDRRPDGPACGEG